MNNFIKFLVFLLVLLGIYFFTPLRHIISKENFEAVRLWITSQGRWAPVVFMCSYMLTAVLCLPGTVLTLLAGIIFGITWGTVWVIIGANLGSFVSAYLARILGRDLVSRLLRGRLDDIDKRISNRGIPMVMWLRLVPVMPYNLLNYALGLSGISLKEIAVGNFFGMLPGIFAYVSIGSATTKVSFTHYETWTKIEIWGPFVLILFLSFLPRVFKKPGNPGATISR